MRNNFLQNFETRISFSFRKKLEKLKMVGIPAPSPAFGGSTARGFFFLISRHPSKHILAVKAFV